MNGKMKLVALLTMIAVGCLASASYADRDDKGCCPMGGKSERHGEKSWEHRGHSGKWGHEGKMGGALDGKFFHKASMILKHKKELALSDKQIADLKSLKLETEKNLVMKKAEIEMVSLDIRGKLTDETIDTKAVNALIDKKYDLKKEKEKSLVTAFASLKSLLTDEQKASLKQLRHSKD